MKKIRNTVLALTILFLAPLATAHNHEALSSPPQSFGYTTIKTVERLTTFLIEPPSSIVVVFSSANHAVANTADIG